MTYRRNLGPEAKAAGPISIPVAVIVPVVVPMVVPVVVEISGIIPVVVSVVGPVWSLVIRVAIVRPDVTVGERESSEPTAIIAAKGAAKR
jgi:hypothetical protein